MANIHVNLTDRFEDWRVKTNEIGDVIGDSSLLPITIDQQVYPDILTALSEVIENSNDITDLISDISINAADITTNANAISTNADDISLLTTAIGDTDSGIIKSLGDNSAQITINTADIAANTLVISANTSAIAAIEQVAVYNLSGTKLN